MEFMRRSLIDAYNLLDEQSNALAEAHLMDKGSTQRIYELGQRGQLAEAGAAHIVQESMAMRRRYHSELENASQLIREQQEISEAMANHYRQDGLQLREACAQYVNEKEMANKEEMEILKQKMVESSQMMVVNNEMVMEHGQQAVALRDGQMAEMQSTINELTASLRRRDDIIAAKDSATRDHFTKVRDLANMAQKKEDEYLMKRNELQVEIRSLMRLNENEMASKEWHEERFIEEKNEYRRFRYTELQASRIENSLLRLLRMSSWTRTWSWSSPTINWEHESLNFLDLGSASVMTKPVPRWLRSCMRNFAKQTWKLVDFKKE